MKLWNEVNDLKGGMSITTDREEILVHSNVYWTSIDVSAMCLSLAFDLRLK